MEQKVTSIRPKVLNRSSNQANDFVDSILIPAPKIIVTISVVDVQLRISEAKEKDTYLVQTSNSPQSFKLQGWRAKQMLKHRKDLI